jgi:hypothetical protein
VTDDEATCVAMLHGCEFFQFDFASKIIWYARDSAGATSHPVEVAQFKARGYYWFHTSEELAHAYCKHFNIGW